MKRGNVFFSEEASVSFFDCCGREGREIADEGYVRWKRVKCLHDSVPEVCLVAVDVKTKKFSRNTTEGVNKVVSFNRKFEELTSSVKVLSNERFANDSIVCGESLGIKEVEYRGCEKGSFVVKIADNDVKRIAGMVSEGDPVVAFAYVANSNAR